MPSENDPDRYQWLRFDHPVTIPEGHHARMVVTDYDWANDGSPLQLGDLFERDGSFGFARGHDRRFRFHPIVEEDSTYIGSRGGERRSSRIVVPTSPGDERILDVHMGVERVTEGIRLRMIPDFLDPLTFVAIKPADQVFSEKQDLRGPDDYVTLSGSHVVEPGSSARIFCPGTSFFTSELTGGRSPKFWRAGDLVSKEGIWTFDNPHAKSPENRRTVLRPGEMAFIGRAFQEGFHHEVVPGRMAIRADDGAEVLIFGPDYVGIPIPQDRNYASGWHAVVEITPQGEALITDFSSNGTVVCIKPSDRGFSRVRRLKQELVESTKPRGGWHIDGVAVGDGRKYAKEDHPIMRSAAEQIGTYQAREGNPVEFDGEF